MNSACNISVLIGKEYWHRIDRDLGAVTGATFPHPSYLVYSYRSDQLIDMKR
jgi:hypothetical protein